MILFLVGAALNRAAGVILQKPGLRHSRASSFLGSIIPAIAGEGNFWSSILCAFELLLEHSIVIPRSSHRRRLRTSSGFRPSVQGPGIVQTEVVNSDSSIKPRSIHRLRPSINPDTSVASDSERCRELRSSAQSPPRSQLRQSNSDQTTVPSHYLCQSAAHLPVFRSRWREPVPDRFCRALRA